MKLVPPSVVIDIINLPTNLIPSVLQLLQAPSGLLLANFLRSDRRKRERKFRQQLTLAITAAVDSKALPTLALERPERVDTFPIPANVSILVALIDICKPEGIFLWRQQKRER